jgi:ribokinase
VKVSAAVPDCDVLLLQGEITTAASARAAHTVRAGGGLVVLNPAPVHDISAEMVAAADVIVPNEVEARALVPGGKALNGPALAAALHQPGRTAVVTLGARGAAWHADSNHGFVAPPAITAVDATAAGDSFCAALALRIAEGAGYAEAVRFACAAGAHAARVPGAEPSLPTRADVEALLTRSEALE